MSINAIDFGLAIVSGERELPDTMEPLYSWIASKQNPVSMSQHHCASKNAVLPEIDINTMLHTDYKQLKAKNLCSFLMKKQRSLCSLN
jgi:hypothetical protein